MSRKPNAVSQTNLLEITGMLMESPPSTTNTAVSKDSSKRNSHVSRRLAASIPPPPLSTANKGGGGISSSSGTTSRTQLLPARKFAVKTPSALKSSAFTSSSIDNLDSKSNLRADQDELAELRRRIDELEQRLLLQEKKLTQKDATIQETSKKLVDSLEQELHFLNRVAKNEKRKEQVLMRKLATCENSLEVLRTDNETLHKRITQSDEILRHASIQAKLDMDMLKASHAKEMQDLRDEHAKELAKKDEKLQMLKSHIATTLKDNSWERQQQIDELNRELKRAYDEYELIKLKLKGYKSGGASTACSNCATLMSRVEERSKAILERDATIGDLVDLLRRFQHQINFQIELTKLAGANKHLNELLAHTKTHQSSALSSSSTTGATRSNSRLTFNPHKTSRS